MKISKVTRDFTQKQKTESRDIKYFGDQNLMKLFKGIKNEVWDIFIRSKNLFNPKNNYSVIVKTDIYRQLQKYVNFPRLFVGYTSTITTEQESNNSFSSLLKNMKILETSSLVKAQWNWTIKHPTHALCL